MSEYDITFLHRFMSPDSGVALHLKEADKSLTLTKAGAFEAWRDDTMKITLKSGTKSTSEANRAYLHYIIDCWLDDKPVELQPSEL
jgi:hypothetical protein